MARDLQREFHPDKVSQFGSEALTTKMAKYSTYINEAKATLLNDLQRAIYLMELKGVRMAEEVDATDSQFMMDIFEINEGIENATLPQAQEIKRRLDGVLEGLQQDLEDFFQSQDMQKCKEFVVKYKYLHSALANVKQRIAALQEKAQGQ
jgi:Fe-S protein assembly co-chaperone HscB